MTTDRGDRSAKAPGRAPVRPPGGGSTLGGPRPGAGGKSGGNGKDDGAATGNGPAGATALAAAVAPPDDGATASGVDAAAPVAAPAGAKAGRIGRPRGPRRSRDERRAELLDAAERAIRRIGPQASMDELAAEAGITKPILYSHFGDKAGMAAALTERVAAELDRTLVASMSKVQSPEQVVSSTIDAFCSFVETETELYHFLWYAAMNQTDRSGAKLLIAGFADQIAFTLGSALRQVGEDSGAAEPWAYAIVGMTLTAGEWWLARRTMTRDDLVSYLTQLLWGGLAGAGLDRLSAVFDPLNPSAANVTLLPPAAGNDT
jgi:AcrR family transcriptional regulator